MYIEILDTNRQAITQFSSENLPQRGDSIVVEDLRYIAAFTYYTIGCYPSVLRYVIVVRKPRWFE